MACRQAERLSPDTTREQRANGRIDGGRSAARCSSFEWLLKTVREKRESRRHQQVDTAGSERFAEKRSLRPAHRARPRPNHSTTVRTRSLPLPADRNDFSTSIQESESLMHQQEAPCWWDGSPEPS